MKPFDGTNVVGKSEGRQCCGRALWIKVVGKCCLECDRLFQVYLRQLWLEVLRRSAIPSWRRACKTCLNQLFDSSIPFPSCLTSEPANQPISQPASYAPSQRSSQPSVLFPSGLTSRSSRPPLSQPTIQPATTPAKQQARIEHGGGRWISAVMVF